MSNSTTRRTRPIPSWNWLLLLFAIALLIGSTLHIYDNALVALAIPAVIGAVIAAVHHAEVVAQRVGEPFGTLVLAVAVTTIEVALILAVRTRKPCAHYRAYQWNALHR
jgi:Ca2+:H+ antiporter